MTCLAKEKSMLGILRPGACLSKHGMIALQLRLLTDHWHDVVLTAFSVSF